MHLETRSHSSNTEEIENYPKWILEVGDGRIYELNDEYADITISSELLLSDYVDLIEMIVTSTYPNLLQNSQIQISYIVELF